jgi:hypothetical protein
MWIGHSGMGLRGMGECVVQFSCRVRCEYRLFALLCVFCMESFGSDSCCDVVIV